MHAVGRIAYRGRIDNIQVSWVKTGVPGARQVLQAGCNDLGGTLMDENISRAAGASHGQELSDEDFRSIVEPARPHPRAAHDALRPDPDRRPPAPPRGARDHAPAVDGDPRDALRGSPSRERTRERASMNEVDTKPAALDVVGLGNALVDVLSHEADAFLAGPGLVKGTMDLIDTERAEPLYGGDGPGDRDLGRVGREHDRRRRVVRQPRRVHRAGPRRPARARCSPTTSAPPACSSTDARGRRPAHRPVPDRGHARRRAHAEHLPRRVRRARRPRTSTRPIVVGAQVTYLEGYLWDQPRRQGRVPATRPGSRTRPAGGSRSRSRTRSASTATATTSSTWSSAIGRHPVRQRGRDLLALRGRRLRRRAAAA